MSNYFRAIRVTFKHRLMIVAALFCALMVSILWSVNIGVMVYPIVEICLKKETFSTWIEKTTRQADETIREVDATIAAFDAKIAEKPDDVASLKSQRGWAEYNNGWAKYKQGWMLWLKPSVIRFTPSTPFRTMVFLLAIAFTGTLLKIFFLIAHGILSAMIAQYGAMEIREEFFRKALKFEANHFNREGVADTMSRFTNDMNTLTGGLMLIYGKVVREPLKMIGCLAGAAWVSWQLLLLTLLVAPLAAVSIRWLAKSIKRVVRRALEEMSVMYARLEETFRSIRIVKAFTREPFERAKFRKTNRAYCQKAIKIAKYESLANPLTELFGILMISIAVIAGSYLVMEDRTTLLGIPMSSAPFDFGMLILFFMFLIGAADPARRLSDIFTSFQGAAAAADRVYDMIDRDVPIRDPATPKPFPRHSRSIRFENICFEYTPSRPILKDVSLEIRFGECIAILGASGCGKSTLMNLLPRFADPNSGRVLVDDVSIADVRMLDLRRQIGLVTQEPFLFNDTVMNNILYGSQSGTRDEAIDAARKAFAHDFIVNELSQGYETIVGPGGGLLSGGQRQRIALARAMIRDPSIFLLDEATSQIDLNSEKMIHDALETFKKGRTTILVTHRLSAVGLADRIVVMEEGKIAAVGKHAELLESCSFYAKLYQD